MRILNNNYILLSFAEMQEKQQSLSDNHGWKNIFLDKSFYIVPSNFFEQNNDPVNLLSFDVSEFDIETLAEDIANIHIDILTNSYEKFGKNTEDYINKLSDFINEKR